MRTPFGHKVYTMGAEYPSAAALYEAAKVVRDAGFSHGFTTLSGSLSAGSNPYLLPRYGLGLRDSHVASLVPLLAAGNQRLRRWQTSLETSRGTRLRLKTFSTNAKHRRQRCCMNSRKSWMYRPRISRTA